MPNPLSAKDYAELGPRAINIECPRCKAKPGEKCVYQNHGRRRAGNHTHDVRMLALRKSENPNRSRYDGSSLGTNHEDLRPIASRRLTLREMRDAGIWVPVKERSCT